MTEIPSGTIKIIAGHLLGSNSPEAEEKFSAWRSAPGNEAVYEDFCKVWSDTVSPEEDSFDSGYAWEKLSRSLSALSIKHNFFRRRIVRIAAVAAAVVLAAVLGYNLQNFNRKDEVQFASVSGKSLAILPDGSEVTLDSGSTLCYNASFGNGSRNVTSTGRAFFAVEKDPHHPFIIDAGGLEIKVLGTKFGVDSGRDNVRVSLIEGSVALSSKATGETLTMSRGQIATFDRASGALKTESGEVADEVIWCSNRLTFSDATLDEVCRKLSHWYGVNVVLSDYLYGKGRISFSITDESLDEVLSIISKTTRTSYRFESPRSILIY